MFHDPLWTNLSMGGQLTTTSDGKYAWLIGNLSIAALGGIFVYLQMSSRLNFSTKPIRKSAAD